MMSPAAGILKQATVMDEGTRPIYMDMQATTPTDPRVLDSMLPFLTGLYGNPHSRTHAYGWETDNGVEQARTHIANLIGADPKEIIFTSGATESNNMRPDSSNDLARRTTSSLAKQNTSAYWTAAGICKTRASRSHTCLCRPTA
jgi:selenocysteine lyase/cysteine desulfurase